MLIFHLAYLAEYFDCHVKQLLAEVDPAGVGVLAGRFIDACFEH